MCGPAAVLIGATLASGFVSYQASKNAQRYNSAVADQNMAVANAKAIDEERLGQIEAQEKRLETRMKIAQQSTGFGAQNVEQTGTALDILGDTAMFGEIDQTRIRASAARRAWGYRMQAHEIDSQRRLDKYTGRMDRFGTILTTAGGVASAWGSRNRGGNT